MRSENTRGLSPTPREFDGICLGADSTKSFKVSPGDAKMQLRATDSELGDSELCFQDNRAFRATLGSQARAPCCLVTSNSRDDPGGRESHLLNLWPSASVSGRCQLKVQKAAGAGGGGGKREREEKEEEDKPSPTVP